MARVLLVEDESIIAMLTEDMLSEIGLEVGVSAATLREGLEAAETQPFDVAVLDINLRGELSYPIAVVLQERNIPFIFASGYAERGVDTRFRDVPALNKPFTLERLQQAISQALEHPQ